MCFVVMDCKWKWSFSPLPQPRAKLLWRPMLCACVMDILVVVGCGSSPPTHLLIITVKGHAALYVAECATNLPCSSQRSDIKQTRPQPLQCGSRHSVAGCMVFVFSRPRSVRSCAVCAKETVANSSLPGKQLKLHLLQMAPAPCSTVPLHHARGHCRQREALQSRQLQRRRQRLQQLSRAWTTPVAAAPLGRCLPSKPCVFCVLHEALARQQTLPCLAKVLCRWRR